MKQDLLGKRMPKLLLLATLCGIANVQRADRGPLPMAEGKNQDSGFVQPD